MIRAEAFAGAVGRDQVECGATDAELVRAARRDPAAFAPLYNRYARRVYWYCYLKIGQHEAAEDATSPAFAKALASIATCREDRFRAWLFSLVRNVVADHFRAPRDALPLDPALPLTDPSPSPEELAVASEEIDVLHRLLARLPDGQRQVVELRLSGLTGAEVARALGRGHVWVRLTQLRAYERLRRIVEEGGSW